jgi:hypothetical protein
VTTVEAAAVVEAAPERHRFTTAEYYAMAEAGVFGPKLRTELIAIYARAGIPEVWVINLVDRVIETHSDPADGAYRDQDVHKPGGPSPRSLPRLPALRRRRPRLRTRFRTGNLRSATWTVDSPYDVGTRTSVVGRGW